MTNLLQNQNNNFGGDFSPPQQLRGETAKWDKEHGLASGGERRCRPSIGTSKPIRISA
jgi:hypothetical protein